MPSNRWLSSPVYNRQLQLRRWQPIVAVASTALGAESTEACEFVFPAVPLQSFNTTYIPLPPHFSKPHFTFDDYLSSCCLCAEPYLLLAACSLVCGSRLPLCPQMAPPRTMTGDTFTDDKTPPSPISPTDTDATLTGSERPNDCGDCHSTIRPSVRTNSIDIESAQPGT